MSDASNAPVITRFAPSPTGFLHIGGVRTALFNWLFAKHHDGQFLVRIEDTDKARSTKEAVDAILDGLAWMGLESDIDPVSQSARAKRHVEVANQLLAAGHAYHCYCSPEELAAMREAGHGYTGLWRDRDPADAPKDIAPVVRFKSPIGGDSVIQDAVQGEVRVANSQLDDLIILRADGSPTYNLSVVVDDHDMAITHVIRGDDHLNNAFRQKAIYEAMDWSVPTFAHIPLIHGKDGAKLSKRHGALGVEAYRDMGMLPEGVFNYLLRLGWSHGDEEIFSREQAIELFNLDSIGKSPSRFDVEKMTSVNHHWMTTASPERLFEFALPFLSDAGLPANENSLATLAQADAPIKERSKTLLDYAKQANFFIGGAPSVIEDKAAKALDQTGKDVLRHLVDVFQAMDTWDHESLQNALKSYAEQNDLKVGKVFQPLRAALTGSMASPGVVDVAEVIGKTECIARIQKQID